MAANYLQGTDPRDPLASPVYGDYRGLPPLLVQVAINEALYDDATRMVDAARRDGVSADLDTYADTVHVFQMFDFLPERLQPCNVSRNSRPGSPRHLCDSLPTSEACRSTPSLDTGAA